MTKSSYLVFLFSAELDKRRMYIIQRRRGKTRRGRRFLLGLRRRTRALLRGGARGRTSTSGRRRTGGRQSTATRHVGQWGLHGRSMRIDPVRHYGTVGSRKGSSGTRTSTRRSCRWTIGSRRVAIGSIYTVGRGLGGLSLRLRSTRMTPETRTFEQVLFLTRGVLCANLLAVDTLDRETLYSRRW